MSRVGNVCVSPKSSLSNKIPKRPKLWIPPLKKANNEELKTRSFSKSFPKAVSPTQPASMKTSETACTFTVERQKISARVI